MVKKLNLTMAIIRWDPFRELEKFFEESFLVPTLSISTTSIPVDIYETDKELVVEVGVPGFSKNDIKVRVENDRVIVEGKKETKEEAKEERYYRKEIRKEKFSRVIYLPYEVDPDEAKAEMKDGVLKVVFPKSKEETKGKELEIS